MSRTITIKGAGKVNIGQFCAIGEDVTIISSNHAVNSIAAQYDLQLQGGSNSAKPIRRRASEEVSDFILELAWLEWQKEKILASRLFFSSCLESVTVEQLRKTLGVNT